MRILKNIKNTKSENIECLMIYYKQEDVQRDTKKINLQK